MGKLELGRVYEPRTDGKRVLADRLWPRGITKEDAAIDYWAKEITPSTEIRKKWHEEAIDFAEFEKEYRKELKDNEAFPPFVKQIDEWLKEGDVTLLTSAKHEPPNHLTVLRDAVKAYRK